MENLINHKNNIPDINECNNLRDFTVSRKNQILYPWQVTGLTDGEGSFCYSLSNAEHRSDEDLPKGGVAPLRSGIKLNLEFKITQKSHSEGILHEVKDYFGCGSVVIDNRKTDTKKFHIKSLSLILNKVIPHFEKYPCLTSKQLNFIDWKSIAVLMNDKKHLTLNGMQEIKNIISRINNNRPFEDKFNFCKSNLGLKSLNKDLFSVDYDLPNHWVQTFLTGEGVFYNYLNEENIKIDSSLEIGQNSHDVAILIALQKFFKGGYLKPKYNYLELSECKNSRLLNRFVFRNTESIIKFVDEYPMLTRKQLDYLNWKEIVEIKNNGLHKTKEGLELIKTLKSQMNLKRDLS